MTQRVTGDDVQVWDDFERADTATGLGTAASGQTWANDQDFCKITSGAVAEAGTGLTGRVFHLLPGYTPTTGHDIEVNAQVKTSATTNATDLGLMMCSTSPTTTGGQIYFRMRKVSGTNAIAFLLRQDTSGVDPILTQDTAAALADNTTYTVQITRAGDVITAFIDGTQRLTYTLTSGNKTTLTNDGFGLHRHLGNDNGSLLLDIYGIDPGYVPVVAAGDGSGAVTWAAAATGSASHGGTAVAGITWTATAAGSAPRGGTGLGSLTWVASATASTPHNGTAAGGITWVGSATSSQPLAGSATGALAWAASATGSTVHAGTGVGSAGWVASATGITALSGAGTGSHTWAGTATGLAPSVPGSGGQGVGALSWAGAAAGARTSQGDAATSLAWDGTASGTTTRSGSAAGDLTWTGSADGRNGDNFRDITLTYQTAGEPWAAEMAADRWQDSTAADRWDDTTGPGRWASTTGPDRWTATTKEPT